MTETVQSMPCSKDELRTLFLFEKLTDDQLEWLCREGHVELIPTGPLFTEGDPATCFYVLLEGTLVMSRRVGADDVEVTRSSNPGVYGGLFGLPVINQPNVAILGLGAIEKRPVVVDDAIAIRSMVYLTLSYDHRVVDGAVAHQFMGHIKHTLENWTESIL